jgi:hypothetical protein
MEIVLGIGLLILWGLFKLGCFILPFMLLGFFIMMFMEAIR